MKRGINWQSIKQEVGSACSWPKPRLLQRVYMRVLLQNRIPEHTIGEFLGCHTKTVSNWRNRFERAQGILDLPRSGRPLTIPPEATLRLIAFYCQHDPLPGCTRWSIRWAQAYLQQHPEILQCALSRSSLHRRLNAHAVRPYRHKYFLQICDPLFFEKMEKIIRVYGEQHPYLFCLDECTGLQALERIAPTLPADGKKPVYQESEYKRHGTVSVLSFLRVSTGHVFTECIPDHTSSTVIGSVRTHVMQFEKSAELHYICDNYSSHSTEEFCVGIAQLCAVQLPCLKTVGQRRQWLESTDKRIVFHFLPTHGSWLNLIEIWFGILQQKALKHESFRSDDELCARIMNFTDTWNSHFAHPFKWTYTGHGLHEKVIGRFTTWLQIESPQLTAKFLEKQMALMTNLVKKYWTKANTKSWLNLKTTLSEKNQFLSKIIGTDEVRSALLINLCKELDNNLKAH